MPLLLRLNFFTLHPMQLLQQSNAEYHSDTSRISKSGLDLVARSPLHYRAKYLAPDRQPQKESPALLLGSAIHSAVLEPDSFAADYCAAIACDRRTSDGKKQWADFLAANAGKTVLDREQLETVLGIRQAIRNHSTASRLLDLSLGQVEGVLHADIPVDGEVALVLAKSRMDYLRTSGEFIADIKSTEDASPNAFARSIANYRYHVQAAYYLDMFAFLGVEPPKRFVFIAVEKSAPYAVAVYYLTAEDIAVGREVYRENLAAYAACMRTGIWAGYPEKPQAINLPTWALNS